jgi:hypothetical protein
MHCITHASPMQRKLRMELEKSQAMLLRLGQQNKEKED